MHIEKKATKAAEEHEPYSVQTHGSDDFGDFLAAEQRKEDAQQQLAQHLDESEWQPDSANTLLALIRCLEYKGVAMIVIKAIEEHYAPQGTCTCIVIENGNELFPMCWGDVNLVESLVNSFDSITDDQLEGLSSYHWLMGMKPRGELIE